MDKPANAFTRKQFWIRIVISFFVVSLGINLLVSLFVGGQLANEICAVGLVIYWAVLEVRRFHDANKSGWFALINLVPALGTIIAVIFAGVLESNYENNKWYTGA